MREPFDVHMVHTHDSVQGYMMKRLRGQCCPEVFGDKGEGITHKLTWNFYEPRKRWEAVCEHTDVLFYAAAVPEDFGFRTFRILK
jgi:hypothetical protein